MLRLANGTRLDGGIYHFFGTNNSAPSNDIVDIELCTSLISLIDSVWVVLMLFLLSTKIGNESYSCIDCFLVVVDVDVIAWVTFHFFLHCGGIFFSNFASSKHLSLIRHASIPTKQHSCCLDVVVFDHKSTKFASKIYRN